jgi:hypothetical protein
LHGSDHLSPSPGRPAPITEENVVDPSIDVTKEYTTATRITGYSFFDFIPAAREIEREREREKEGSMVNWDLGGSLRPDLFFFCHHTHCGSGMLGSIDG